MMDPMALMNAPQPTGMEGLLPLIQGAGKDMLKTGDEPVQPEEVNVPLGNDYKQELINSILQAFAPSNPIMDLMRMFQPQQPMMMQPPMMMPGGMP